MLNVVILIGILIGSTVMEYIDRNESVDVCMKDTIFGPINAPESEIRSHCEESVAVMLRDYTIFNVAISFLLIYGAAIVRSFYLDINSNPTKYGVGTTTAEVTDLGSPAYPLSTFPNPYAGPYNPQNPYAQPPLPPYQPPPPKYEADESLPRLNNNNNESVTTFRDGDLESGNGQKGQGGGDGGDRPVSGLGSSSSTIAEPPAAHPRDSTGRPNAS
ncbi:hypothetical protein HK097_002682 [Rhizophlyctis rosea]|uniref:Uncharacterized protein n=1 Tax=Rhizophlyctis rosea TaxID=64517 RepID=A0AAD5SFD1_9FUNG|nr:hypothetical protein HK097_002682 [Rhizophlyctis rosea]